MCVCVCLCVQAAHLRLTQLSDKLDILTDLVSCWLQNEFGVFRFLAKLDMRPPLAYTRMRFHRVSGTRVWLYSTAHTNIGMKDYLIGKSKVPSYIIAIHLAMLAHYTC